MPEKSTLWLPRQMLIQRLKQPEPLHRVRRHVTRPLARSPSFRLLRRMFRRVWWVHRVVGTRPENVFSDTRWAPLEEAFLLFLPVLFSFLCPFPLFFIFFPSTSPRRGLALGFPFLVRRISSSFPCSYSFRLERRELQIERSKACPSEAAKDSFKANKGFVSTPWISSIP